MIHHSCNKTWGGKIVFVGTFLSCVNKTVLYASDRKKRTIFQILRGIIKLLYDISAVCINYSQSKCFERNMTVAYYFIIFSPRFSHHFSLGRNEVKKQLNTMVPRD